MSKLTPYAALCEIFKSKFFPEDVTGTKFGEGERPKSTQSPLKIDNSCQTQPLRDYSFDKVLKTPRKIPSFKNVVKDDNFQILHPDYDVYSAEYSNKIKLVAEKPQEENDKFNLNSFTPILNKLRDRIGSPVRTKSPEVRHETTMTDPQERSHFESQNNNDLIFPELNLYRNNTVYNNNIPFNPRRTNQIHTQFRNPKINAVYRTVSDLRTAFDDRYDHCDNDEKCLCEHCGAWNLINDSLKRPQIFDNSENHEQDTRRQHRTKKNKLNDKDYLKLVMKLKMMEERIHELEEMTYVQGPMKYDNSLSFDMYTQCNKKKKQTKFKDTENSRSWSPRRIYQQNCPFPFGLPPNIFKRRTSSETREEQDYTDSDDYKVEHESRPTRRSFLPKPKLRCQDYITKKTEESSLLKKTGFWRSNKETFNIQISDDISSEQNKKGSTIEINLDTITEKEVQDLLIRLNKRKILSQVPTNTEIIYKGNHNNTSSRSCIPSQNEIPLKYQQNKRHCSTIAETSKESSATSYDYNFLKQPNLIDNSKNIQENKQKSSSTRSTKQINSAPRVPTIKKTNHKVEITKMLGEISPIIDEKTNVCDYFNNNFSARTSTTDESFDVAQKPQKTETKKPNVTNKKSTIASQNTRFGSKNQQTNFIELSKNFKHNLFGKKLDEKAEPINSTTNVTDNSRKKWNCTPVNLKLDKKSCKGSFGELPKVLPRKNEVKFDCSTTDSCKTGKISYPASEDSNTTEKSGKNIFHVVDKPVDKSLPKNDNVGTKMQETTKKSSFLSVLKNFSKQIVPRKPKSILKPVKQSPIPQPTEIQIERKISKPASKTTLCKTKPILRSETAFKKLKPLELEAQTPLVSKKVSEIPKKKTVDKSDTKNHPSKIPRYSPERKNTGSVSTSRSTSPQSCKNISPERYKNSHLPLPRKHFFHPAKEDANTDVLLSMKEIYSIVMKQIENSKTIDKYCMFKPEMVDKCTKLSNEHISPENTTLSINTIILNNIESMFHSPKANMAMNSLIVVKPPSNETLINNLTVDTNIIQNLMLGENNLLNNNQVVLFSTKSKEPLTNNTSENEIKIREHNYLEDKSSKTQIKPVNKKDTYRVKRPDPSLYKNKTCDCQKPPKTKIKPAEQKPKKPESAANAKQKIPTKQKEIRKDDSNKHDAKCKCSECKKIRKSRSTSIETTINGTKTDTENRIKSRSSSSSTTKETIKVKTSEDKGLKRKKYTENDENTNKKPKKIKDEIKPVRKTSKRRRGSNASISEEKEASEEEINKSKNEDRLARKVSKSRRGSNTSITDDKKASKEKINKNSNEDKPARKTSKTSSTDEDNISINENKSAEKSKCKCEECTKIRRKGSITQVKIKPSKKVSKQKSVVPKERSEPEIDDDDNSKTESQEKLINKCVCGTDKSKKPKCSYCKGKKQLGVDCDECLLSGVSSDVKCTPEVCMTKCRKPDKIEKCDSKCGRSKEDISKCCEHLSNGSSIKKSDSCCRIKDCPRKKNKTHFKKQVINLEETSPKIPESNSYLSGSILKTNCEICRQKHANKDKIVTSETYLQPQKKKDKKRNSFSAITGSIYRKEPPCVDCCQNKPIIKKKSSSDVICQKSCPSNIKQSPKSSKTEIKKKKFSDLFKYPKKQSREINTRRASSETPECRRSWSGKVRKSSSEQLLNKKSSDSLEKIKPSPKSSSDSIKKDNTEKRRTSSQKIQKTSSKSLIKKKVTPNTSKNKIKVSPKSSNDSTKKDDQEKTKTSSSESLVKEKSGDSLGDKTSILDKLDLQPVKHSEKCSPCTSKTPKKTYKKKEKAPSRPKCKCPPEARQLCISGVCGNCRKEVDSFKGCTAASKPKPQRETCFIKGTSLPEKMSTKSKSLSKSSSSLNKGRKSGSKDKSSEKSYTSKKSCESSNKPHLTHTNSLGKNIKQIKSKITSKFSCRYFKNLYRCPRRVVTSVYKKRHNNYCDVINLKDLKEGKINKKTEEKKSKNKFFCPCLPHTTSSIIIYFYMGSSFYDTEDDDSLSWSDTDDDDIILTAEEKQQYLQEKLNLLQDYRSKISNISTSESNYGAFE